MMLRRQLGDSGAAQKGNGEQKQTWVGNAQLGVLMRRSRVDVRDCHAVAWRKRRCPAKFALRLNLLSFLVSCSRSSTLLSLPIGLSLSFSFVTFVWSIFETATSLRARLHPVMILGCLRVEISGRRTWLCHHRKPSLLESIDCIFIVVPAIRCL